ncbi:unnamed protein product [Clonostachys rosea f. rosea IK726]|uniref:Uncharacterized protein n=1 Tax=Clonostachys rosea f. rosea IK726 TaxID=1349383 RepID=A0ACA9UC61_BIOOC|nr:unnamed protein product [Clonostachys rosea f. rosea IK726]
MIRRGPWKYITCPADEPQLFNLARDPHELDNLARFRKIEPKTAEEQEAKEMFDQMKAEADARWDYDAITAEVFHSQRRRRVVWDALKLGSFTSWDFNPEDDGRQKYIRSTIPLDDLERPRSLPFVDVHGAELKSSVVNSTRGG